MLQFFDRLGLDLPHALAGDLEDAAHLFQGVGVAVAQAVAQADDLPLAVGERFEQGFDAFAKQFIAGGLFRSGQSTVFDELPETTIFAFSDRSVKAYRMPSHRQNPAGFVHRQVGGGGHLLGGRLPAQLLQELFRDISQLAQARRSCGPECELCGPDRQSPG